MLDLALTALEGLMPAVAGALLLVGVFGRRCIGLAMAAGMFAAYALLRRLPALPGALFLGDNDALEWLLWCSLAAGLAGLLGGVPRLPRWLLVAGGLLVLGGEAWLMLLNRTRPMAPSVAVFLQVAAFGALAAVWLLLRRAASQRQDFWLVAVWTGCLAIDAVLLGLGSSALLGTLAAAATAALATSAATVLWRRPFTIDRSVALPFATVHGGLLLAGLGIAGLPLAPALLAAAAPASLAFAPRQQPGGGHAAFVAMAMVAATLLGAAVGIVWQTRP